MNYKELAKQLCEMVIDLIEHPFTCNSEEHYWRALRIREELKDATSEAPNLGHL